jgi:hypothetical protein
MRTQCYDGSFELSYDDGVVRVVTVPSVDADPPVYYRLQAEVGFECTNPKCLSGIPPVLPEVPCTIEIQMPAEVQMLPGGQQVLLAGAGDSRISIPIFNVSAVPHAARPAWNEKRPVGRRPDVEVADVEVDHEECDDLHRYRKDAGYPDDARSVGMAFHVYKIKDAPDELDVLKGKQIALPIPVRIPASNQMAWPPAPITGLRSVDSDVLDPRTDPARGAISRR